MDISTDCPVSESLGFCLALARTYATLSRQFDGRLGGLHGLSFGDFTLLLQLCRAPGGRLRRVDLAQALGLTASAVTRALIPLEKIEEMHVRRVLERTSSVAEAARVLGIDDATIYRKRKKMGIE